MFLDVEFHVIALETPRRLLFRLPRFKLQPSSHIRRTAIRLQTTRYAPTFFLSLRQHLLYCHCSLGSYAPGLVMGRLGSTIIRPQGVHCQSWMG